jgi:ADP-heptose:LPS heptosyltransferase
LRRPAVLLLRALGLGDFLAGVPAYKAVRAAFPEHETVIACPEALAPLVDLCPALDRLLPTGELAPVRWRGAPPDLAIDLHGNGPASHRLVAATGAARLLSFWSGPQWDENEHEVARWCRLLEWAGIPADPAALGLTAPPPTLTGAIVVHPGASSGSRRWPPERFATVARELARLGPPVVVTGSAAERALAARVALQAGLGEAAVLAGRLDLSALASVVAHAALVLSGDTGVSHLATAYRTPSVTLFGPVSPALWGPPPGPHTVLWKGGSAGRPGDAHGDRPDPRLLRVTVAETIEACLVRLSTDEPEDGSHIVGERQFGVVNGQQ